MKKLVLFAVVAGAMSFASCGGNTADAAAEAKRIQDSIEAEAAKLQQEVTASNDSLANAVDTLANAVKEEVKK